MEKVIFAFMTTCDNAIAVSSAGVPLAHAAERCWKDFVNRPISNVRDTRGKRAIVRAPNEVHDLLSCESTISLRRSE
ncbi:MAG: hypothetical protein NVS4B9_11580 [Ktedonobacteraceae bacterium]